MPTKSVPFTDSMKIKLEKHEKTLFGNGEPGIDEQLRNIMAWIKEQKEEKEKIRAFWAKVGWIIVTPVLAGVVVFVYQAFIFYYQIVPIIEALKPLSRP